jgi:hypothetical protein
MSVARFSSLYGAGGPGSGFGDVMGSCSGLRLAEMAFCGPAWALGGQKPGTGGLGRSGAVWTFMEDLLDARVMLDRAERPARSMTRMN